jgi:hypothetical protein
MKRLYIVLIALLLTAPFAAAQITTERCFHLDKVQFLQHKQDFWRSHRLYSTAARESSGITGGYYNLTELQYGFGLAEIEPPYSNHYLGITTVNGWMFGNGLALGVGVGYQQYNGGYGVPLYGDIRWFLGQQRVKFFVAGSGGMLMNFDDFSEYSALFVNPAAGIIVPLSKSTHLSFSVGLIAQYTNHYFDDPQVAGYRDSFINMKLGLLFGK